MPGGHEVPNSLVDVKLIEHGRPTPLLLNLMKDMVYRLVRIHDDWGDCLGGIDPEMIFNIVRDWGDSRLLAKLDTSRNPSTEWQAPECLDSCPTSAGYMFSLGCALFFCITTVKDPFGDEQPCKYRNWENVNRQIDFLLEDLPEFRDVISSLLSGIPEKRPKAIEVVAHPFLWDSKRRLSFIRDISDLVRDYNSLWVALKKIKVGDLLPQNNRQKGKAVSYWSQHMDWYVVEHMMQSSRPSGYPYDTTSVRDLVKFIRNMWIHYKQLPQNIQGLIGEKYDEDVVDDYITRRFPKLLMVVYEAVRTHCKEETPFKKYFEAKDFH